MNYSNTMIKVLDIPQSLVEYINSLSGLKKSDEISEDEIKKFVDTVCPDEQTLCKTIVYLNELNMGRDPFKSVNVIHAKAYHTMIKYKNIFDHIDEVHATDPISKIWKNYCEEHSIIAPRRRTMTKCIGCNQVTDRCALYEHKDYCPCNTCLVKPMCKNPCLKLIAFVNHYIPNNHAGILLNG